MDKPGRASPESRSGAPPDGSRKARRKKKRRKNAPILRLLVKLAVLALFTLLLFTFVVDVHICRGNGMYPFLQDGDVLIAYKLETCQVGDAVVYRRPDTGEKAVSRVVAVNSDTVEITPLGELLVNSFVPDDKVFYATKPLEGSAITYPVSLTGGVFLLDDHRTEGHDSRLFGEVPRSELLGKVVYVFRRRGI